MALNISLDFKKVAEQDKPVPTSDYPVLVKAFDLKQPKEAGKYAYFSVRAEITDGPHAGRALFMNLTTNPEETENGSQKNFMLFRFLKIFKQVNEAGEANIDPNGIINQPMIWSIVEKDDQNNVSGFKAAA